MKAKRGLDNLYSGHWDKCFIELQVEDLRPSFGYP